MKKLCICCQAQHYMDTWNLRNYTPTETDIFETVESGACELCLKHTAQQEADWQIAKTLFIQNLREIPRDAEFKQQILNAVMDKN